MIQVKSKDGLTIRCTIDTFEYNGSFMGDRNITCTYNSPDIIPFDIGDYIEYRSEKFILDYNPSDTKTARMRTCGDSVSYNLAFHPESYVELYNCEFSDYVLFDNQLHYSPSPKFSFIGTVRDLADRIQANLDRLYPEEWVIEVNSSVTLEDKNIEISNLSCWNALVLANKEYGLNFSVINRKVTIGSPSFIVDHTFRYGLNLGLYKIERNVNSDEAIITRLKVYGSDRNIPSDYNKRPTDAVPKKNLMLPGYKETGIDYIDSDKISKYGIREYSVIFEDIYPSIEGVEVEGIGRIDEIVSTEQINTDNEANKTFKVRLKDIGFDINDYLTSEAATISIKSGSLIGYDFEIVKVDKLNTGGYELTLNKSDRDNWVVPSKDQNLSAGDRFVLLNINMPEVYVTYAENRLLEKAKEYLAKYDHESYTYNIEVDEIFMARNSQLYRTIREGDLLTIYDVDLDIDYSIIIQSLVISEGGPTPTYRIALSDKPISGPIDKIWDAISNIKNQGSAVTSYGGGIAQQEMNRRYIRKDIPDIDRSHLTLAGGVKVENGAIADTLNVEETATTLNLIVKELANTYDLNVEHVATLFQTIVKDYISSSLFIPGFTGSGMKLYQALNGNWNLELDNLTVRKLFNVFELVIQKIRSINGALIISQANGTIESVTDAGDTWQLGFSEEYPVFAVGDLLRCQVFGGKNMKYYWVTVSSVDGSTVNIQKSEFEGVVPAVGDEVVQIGNISDPARQSVIYLSASENGRPVIDVLSGVNSKSFAGKLKGRFGCLDDITDTDFPADYQPSGYGLYSTNAFLKGIFVLRNGKEVETELAALNGEISLRVTKDEYNNAVTGSRNLFLDTKNVADPDIWNLNSAASSVSWEDGFKVCHVYGNWGRIWQSGRFKPGKTYTVTCWIKRDPSLETGVNPTKISLCGGSEMKTIYRNFTTGDIIPTAWTRVVWTFETADNYVDQNLPRIEFYCEDYQNNSPGALIYGYMVVEGDKAASWSPAPEDVERTSKEYSDTQIRLAKGEIDLSITTKINEVQVGTRNYLSNSRIKEIPYENAIYQVVEDPQMGTVIEVVNGPGTDFQFNFPVNDRSMLKNTDLVYFVIAKEMAPGNWLYGGWPETFIMLNAGLANKIDLGGGWYQYWVTFKSGEAGVGSEGSFGINTTSGTWRFYAAGVLKGNKPASWSPAIEDMASKVELESGIQILKESVDTKVSKDIFDDLGRKVTETQSQVLVNTEGITQTVEKTNLATELAIAMASGEMLYTDPTFEEGTNGIFVYNNAGNGNVVITRTNEIYDVPSRLGWALMIQTNGPVYPGNGGFTFHVLPLANATFVVRFIALIPIGYAVVFASNYLGVNSNVTWLTSSAGTGDWQEYGIKIKYGTGSGLGSTAFFYLDGPATYPITPIRWYLSYATVFNVSNAPATATKTQIRQLDDKINLSATAINDLTGRVQSAEFALRPDNIWIGLKDKIKVGGRNTFSYLNTPLSVWDGAVVTREHAYKGFTFSPAGISSNLRLSRVITENGYWTISFDLNANVAGSMYMDFCDIPLPNISVTPGYNGRLSLTVEVTNYSSNIYNFIDIHGLGPGTFLFSNVQVEKGNVPTAWTPNPDDVGTKQELLDTGIDIKNRQIVATADTFKIRSNAGQDIAVFKIGADGQPKLKAQNIDVDNLNVKMLDGATGSFRDLYCKNSSGQNVGRIHFGTDASMWFDGNIYHQTGINSDPRFYAADIWCRGNFGTYMNAIVQVNDGAATYYINGPTNSGQWKGLESKISTNGVGYHPIPLVLQEGGGVAFSPEIVLINSSVTRYYELLGLPGKKVVVINVNRNVACNFFYNGNAVTIQGGHLREFYNVKGFLNPTGSTSRVGYGWMVGADSGTAF